MTVVPATDIGCPVVHQQAPTFEQVGARVGRLGLVPHHVRQRRLDHLPRVVCPFRGPVPEAGPESVRQAPIPSCCNTPDSRASPIALPRWLGNTRPDGMTPVEATPSRRASSRISTARLLSGIRCSRPAFGARRGHRPARPGRCCRRRCGAARARSGRGRASGQRRRSGPTGCRCGACRGWQSPRGRWLSIRVPTTEHISPAPAQPNGYVHGSTGPRPGSRGRGSAGGRRGRGVDLDEPGSVCRCLRRLGVAPARSCVPRGKQSHTARYQRSDATIHYRFHPRSGERVEIVRRHQRAGRSVLVIRQPDGTLAQVPTWMCDPAAAALSVKDPPRIALTGLLDLRLTVDAALSSFSGMEEGERLETDPGSPARQSVGGDAAGTGAEGTDTGDGAPVGGNSAARSDSDSTSDRDQAGGRPGDGGKR